MKKKLWAVLVAFVALTVFATSAFAAVRWRNVASIYPGISAGDNCIALYHAYGQVALPHNAVAGAGHLGGQHLIELVAVFVKTVCLVRQQDAALKLGLVDAAVVNRDFSRCAGIESVQQFRVIKEHGRFVLFTGDGVVDVGKRPCFGILVADLENPIRINAVDGDCILYAARNTELFAFHLLRF